ncbi:hypothetical protein [Myroides odoratus]|uniref:hypothetical protein n=1 Tax=Myroides odoratus TaxID=256 RepID=UPI00333E418E
MNWLNEILFFDVNDINDCSDWEIDKLQSARTISATNVVEQNYLISNRKLSIDSNRYVYW